MPSLATGTRRSEAGAIDRRLHHTGRWQRWWDADVTPRPSETVSCTNIQTGPVSRGGSGASHMLAFRNKGTFRMRTGTLLTPTSMVLVVGLFVLAGVFSDLRPAFAQTQEACPLPAGATPVEAPRVTAQQVENGTGSLMDFALDARERSREHAQGATTVGQGPYIACLVRQEGGPWRSGSTYLVSLTLDGRGVHSREGHGTVGRATQPRDLCRDSLCAGRLPTDLANLTFSRSRHAQQRRSCAHRHIVARTGCSVRCHRPYTGRAAGHHRCLRLRQRLRLV